ncbi:leucine-rich repeat-containing protein 49-like isoform X3 [Centruroides vittatus]|uniref:leucine-rich repeat-containing protein 49-like isoform X3 n=1 Tax=Centruroides vittatus TaxID=120091 RepID=UPI00350ED292
MYTNVRKSSDKNAKHGKEVDLSGLSLLISQAKVNVGEKQKQGSSPKKYYCRTSSPLRNPSKSAGHQDSTGLPSKSSVSTGTTQKSCHDHCHRHHSPVSKFRHIRSAQYSSGSADSSISSPTSENSASSLPSHSRGQWMSGRKLSPRSRHGDTYSGKTKVTIKKSPSGQLIVKRQSEEHNADPEKLILDRCGLLSCPVLEGEDQLRLLNYQHNQIRQIENISTFSYLVFLDLSDNCLEKINGLDGLINLRVLMLSRNRIKTIEGLTSLIHLDVLDLSGNEICEICNLKHLQELHVLNLSSNLIDRIKGVRDLESLIELNLSKNNVTCLEEVDLLPKLQRLFLSHNCIDRFEDLLDVPMLTELSFENCPITQRPHYRHMMIFRFPHLKFLDSKRVLDEEKRTAQVIVRKEELKKQESIRIAKIKEAKERAITNARQQWFSIMKEQGEKHANMQISSLPCMVSSVTPQLLFFHPKYQSGDDDEEDGQCTFCDGSGLPCDFCGGTILNHLAGTICRRRTRKLWQKSKKDQEKKSLRKAMDNIITSEKELSDTHLTHLAEIDDGKLQLYGLGAVVAAFQHSWNPDTIPTIHTVGFHFLLFDSIAPFLGQMKTQFPNISHIFFECANLYSLPQLNAMAQIAELQQLTIEREGNPLTELSLWRLYAIYRLGSSLTTINGTQITTYERAKADDIFGGLGQAVTCFLPKYRLSSLLNNPRVKQLFLKEKGYSLNALQRQSETQVASDVVMKAALIYKPHLDEAVLPSYKVVGKQLLQKSLNNVEETMKKRLVFQTLWPSIFMEMAMNSLKSFTDINRHMKLAMTNLLHQNHKVWRRFDK